MNKSDLNVVHLKFVAEFCKWDGTQIAKQQILHCVQDDNFMLSTSDS